MENIKMKISKIKKNIFVRALVGAPLGVTVSYFITVAISITIGDGSYYPIEPELAADFGNELNAVLAQTLCSLIYGAAFGGASAVWDMDRWSLARMTVTHLIIVCAATFPIAWLMRWMPRSAAGIAVYFGIFLGIYLLIWLSQYSAIKRRIRLINEKLGAESRK